MQMTHRDPDTARPMLSEERTVTERGMKWLLAGLICLSAVVFLKVLAVCVLPLEMTFRLNAWFLSLDLASYLDPSPLIGRLMDAVAPEGKAGELLTEVLSTVTRTAVFQLLRGAVKAVSGLLKGPVTDILRVFTAAAGTAALISEIPTIWAVLCGWIYRNSVRNGGKPRGLRGICVLCWIRLCIHFLTFRSLERMILSAVLPFLGYAPGLIALAAAWMFNRVWFGLRILFDAEVIRSAGLMETAVLTGMPEGRLSRLVPIFIGLSALVSLGCAGLFAIPGLTLFVLYHLTLAAGCVCVAVFFRYASLPEWAGRG